MPPLSFTYTLDTIDEAVGRVLSAIGGHRIVLLDGEMGAGKTTFIKALCRQLGAVGELASPTYSLAYEYAGRDGRIIHLDLYRLTTIEEALSIGVEDYLFSGDWCFIEWAAIIQPLLGTGEYIQIKIVAIGETSRQITIFN